MTWTVKENGANLCVNGDCSNPKKYSVFQKDAYTYILRINNFSMNDVNKWYRCSVGNVSDEIPIYLDDQNFECKFILHISVMLKKGTNKKQSICR